MFLEAFSKWAFGYTYVHNVQGPDRMLSRILPHTSCPSASCLSGVRGWSIECSQVCGTH